MKKKNKIPKILPFQLKKKKKKPKQKCAHYVIEGFPMVPKVQQKLASLKGLRHDHKTNEIKTKNCFNI